MSLYVAACTPPARNIASETVDEDMNLNFMTKMQKIGKKGAKGEPREWVVLVDSVAAEIDRSFIQYYIQKQGNKPKK